LEPFRTRPLCPRNQTSKWGASLIDEALSEEQTTGQGTTASNFPRGMSR
jgi:hypothetical protein